MSQNEGGQERTEEATEKKKSDARKKGQVPRSRELNTAIIVFTGGMTLYAFQNNIAIAFKELTEYSFSFTRQELLLDDFIVYKIKSVFYPLMINLWPIFVLIFSSTFIGSIFLNGFAINFSTMAPKLERMDPIKGVKRMVSLKALMELIKALLKFLLITLFAVIILWFQVGHLMTLGDEPLIQGMQHAFHIILQSFIIMSCALVFVAAIDVPYQLWEHSKEIKMSRQELKDEMKETEGRPEVKQRIRRIQQEMTQKRMMQKVPQADVIVTNPTHFAVALQYQAGKGDIAPIVIAKGVDVLAKQIMTVAEENAITVLRIPLLARALYYHAALDKAIPHVLYEAVAHVLAYVYQLRVYESGKGKRPNALPDLEIPDEMIHKDE